METTRVNLEDVESLQTERDNYKSQVEDLEAIRRAYSQLVEHHPNIEAELVAKEKQIKGTYRILNSYRYLQGVYKRL